MLSKGIKWEGSEIGAGYEDKVGKFVWVTSDREWTIKSSQTSQVGVQNAKNKTRLAKNWFVVKTE